MPFFARESFYLNGKTYLPTEPIDVPSAILATFLDRGQAYEADGPETVADPADDGRRRKAIDDDPRARKR